MVPRAPSPPPVEPETPNASTIEDTTPDPAYEKPRSTSPRNISSTITMSDPPSRSPSLSELNAALPSPTTRNRSPYKRSHMRSHSSTGHSTPPQISRANSSPGPESNRVLPAVMPRPPSPLGPPNTRRFSPLRRSLEEARPTSASGQGSSSFDDTIPEDAELKLPPRPTTSDSNSSEMRMPTPSSTSPYSNNTFPRLGTSRRRPSSPLYQFSSSSSIHSTSPSSSHALRTSTSTPALSGTFNESYPTSSFLGTNTSLAGSSSIPSTPSSFRSRSPSISSLETIPDSPDAEQEAEQIAKLSKAAFDREKELSAEGGGSSGEEEADGVGRRRGRGRGRKGGGGGKEERKRWSVCGAERRGDLDLETIWED